MNPGEYPQERRGGHIELLMLEMGKVHATISNAASKVDSLDIKVGIQNGRIGNIELAKAAQDGYLKGLTVLVAALGVPLVLIIATVVIGKLHF